MMTTNNTNERDIPPDYSHENLLDYPHSVIWRVLHGTCFLFGGLFFIAGSCMYFTRVIASTSNALEIGAWLYIVGSACFLLADLQDWSHYRLGFSSVLKDKRGKGIAGHAERAGQRSKSFSTRCRCIAVDINYFASITGSILYLVGSVFFLPKFADSAVVGDGLFIAGSAAIYLSEGWKISRLACTNAADVNDHRFRFDNLRHNLQAICIAFGAGLGGVFYFVGTILFLPQYITTDFGENRAAALFTCGGVFFSLAGFLLQYRYYCRRRKSSEADSFDRKLNEQVFPTVSYRF